MGCAWGGGGGVKVQSLSSLLSEITHLKLMNIYENPVFISLETC